MTVLYSNLCNTEVFYKGTALYPFIFRLKWSLFIFCLFDLILYVPVNNFSVMSDRSSWVEPVLSKDKCVLLKETTR